MGIFRVERRKLLSNFVGRRGSLYRLRTFVKSHLSRKDKGAARVGHPAGLDGARLAEFAWAELIQPYSILGR